MIDRWIRFFLENRLIAALILVVLAGWGVATAPFDWQFEQFPRSPVPVDAIPDIGDNQQIVFTEWPGRSPQDIEDQITYPLGNQLLGLPGVRTVRGNSMFGFSSIYILFDEDVEFYWSRTRILEKINSLPSGTLPDGVQPTLGPDATGLGQIFWYTLQGRDSDGNPAGGWDPYELRSIQEFHVRPALSGVRGVAEVASIGGHLREIQVDIDPLSMRELNLTTEQIAEAVRSSNLDVGARSIELNRVEYLIRGLGYITSLEDIEESVVSVVNNTPIRVRDVARVTEGPAQRRGAIDLAGADAVGGVVVARHGENPLEVIRNVREAMESISDGLPARELSDGTVSRIEIVPFYDRSGLIYETLGTLEEALTLQILITILVIIVMVMHLRSSFIIAALLPLAVLMSFIMMRLTGVDANVVALAGIAISIGTVVDMGIVLTENMLQHKRESPDENLLEVIRRASSEVSPAIVTALATTIVSFLPVFLLQAEEGRLFGPLAYTKTFILLAALLIVLTLIPAFAHWLFSIRLDSRAARYGWNLMLLLGGIYTALAWMAWGGVVLIGLAVNNLTALRIPSHRERAPLVNNAIILFGIAWLFSSVWLPLGPGNPLAASFLSVLLLIGLLFGAFRLYLHHYRRILQWVLNNRTAFLSLPVLILILGLISWRGFTSTFQPIASAFTSVGIEMNETRWWSALDRQFPGLGREFMPTLDEGSFLLMPTAMPHAGTEESLQLMREMDQRIASIPEVELVVGKIGRVESALDPAPVSMFETLINYKSEYKSDERGRRVRFRVENGEFVRDDNGELIPDRRGRYFRQWREQIRNTDDIWTEVLHAADLPGITSAPKLHPIETRLIMLQTGMRANMGIRVSGPDLESIDRAATMLEQEIRQIEGVRPASVFADRVTGTPYIEIDIDRREIARHGLSVQTVQRTIQTAIGGETVTTTVEGRERYPVRVRYAREFRDTPEAIERILVPAPDGNHIPLGQLAGIRFEPGPMNIRSENTFLTAYVTFDPQPDVDPVRIIERIDDHLESRFADGAIGIPTGVTLHYEGEFRQQQRAADRLALVLPVTLLIIFLIIYFQFRSVPVTLIIFTSIALVWAGGFLMLWLYGQEWFLNISLAGIDLREFLQMGTIHLSVAVWVGFLALFGIAVDDGVIMSTYLNQLAEKRNPTERKSLYETVLDAAERRARPCLMTTGTTLLALLPILSSTGRGAEIMLPMAIPAVGGMFALLLSLLLVPLLYTIWKEATFSDNHPNEER